VARPAYWCHFVYTNALVGVGTVILVSRLLRVSSFYRRQSLSLLAAGRPAVAGQLASSLGLPLARDYDPTPVAVTSRRAGAGVGRRSATGCWIWCRWRAA
jgi:hypothetical protein